MDFSTSSSDLNCEVQRRSDGALIVRVQSIDRGQETLPDAVFSFRAGDPQYDRWEQRLLESEHPES